MSEDKKTDNKKYTNYDLPDTANIKKAYDKAVYRNKLGRSVKWIINILVILVVLAVVASFLFMPVVKIYGDSMNDALDSGDIVLTTKDASIETGDIIAFNYNNNILVKRVIGVSDEWIKIDDEGNVSVDQNELKEPYVKWKSLGNSDIKYPYHVPENKFFVMGDNREGSMDSRNSSVGCISSEQIVGKVIFRVWPFEKFGKVK